ncbi:hypothetical protein HY404_04035 [Candidatus Microgenomates bacterium]|nr:hypothetical protein [Candidatus Microgenomates bacterium]
MVEALTLARTNLAENWDGYNLLQVIDYCNEVITSQFPGQNEFQFAEVMIITATIFQDEGPDVVERLVKRTRSWLNTGAMIEGRMTNLKIRVYSSKEVLAQLAALSKTPFNGGLENGGREKSKKMVIEELGENHEISQALRPLLTFNKDKISPLMKKEKIPSWEGLDIVTLENIADVIRSKNHPAIDSFSAYCLPKGIKFEPFVEAMAALYNDIAKLQGVPQREFTNMSYGEAMMCITVCQKLLQHHQAADVWRLLNILASEGYERVSVLLSPH